MKIISNVKVPARSEPSSANIQQTTHLDGSSEAEALNNVASGIATSLGLVDIVVLDDNQQYILQQQEDHTGQPEFIIPELTTGENHFAGQVITTQHSAVLPQSMILILRYLNLLNRENCRYVAIYGSRYQFHGRISNGPNGS